MLNSGQHLRQFQVERFLGCGGMGEVYLALDTRLHRKVALKVLPAADGIDAARKKRFVREAIAASRLTHPNVCVVYDADETEDGLAFISMEYVEGETLESRLRRGPLPLEDVRRYGVQIADGLEEAHRRGIVHRDIKPGNVMIDRRDCVKILDFGLARVFEEEPVAANSGDFTRSAESYAIAGTPSFMSPEQARGEHLDHRSDIFSFGAILYQMITGRSPFAAPSAAVAVSRVLDSEPPAMHEIRPDVTPDLERIVSKALEKDRGLRYQTAREIAVDLQRIGETSPRKREKRSWNPIVLAAAAVVIAVTLAAFFWMRARPAAANPIRSLAVLPFQSLSPKPEGDYLADGVTEALISDLAQIKALKVISRTSVMQYKKTQKALPQIGRELGADAVIEGSVVEAGGQVRVIAQLIDARKDRHLWAQSYDRDMRDVLRLEDEIARTVADAVRVQLLPAEKVRLTHARRIDPQAHELYVEARYDQSTRAWDGLRRSVGLLEAAVAAEPGWAPAWAALANSYNLLSNNDVIGREDGYPKGKAAALRAVQLDPDLAEAHTALAFNLWHYDYNWEAAGKEFRRAIALQPSYAEAHHFYALYLTSLGKDSQAVAEIRKALELDPLSPRINTNYGDILRLTGHETEAVEQFQKSLPGDPIQASRGLVFSYVTERKSNEAVKMAEYAAAIHQPVAGPLRALALASQQGAAALPFIRQIERQPATSKGNTALVLALAYLQAGDRESAWRLLKPFETRFSSAMWIREPLLDPLRSDPRFAEVLNTIRLR